ncbi:hypothetical protein [Cryobacterium sp.]|jgi:hypothetical protein|uniref:hypothetical protein n=1 Tax=Cryobacterium sp. TaxID=1926290 RepID=UPI002637437E|nr:hypothetical protein [Cryobacterium sp.]MCU1444782.1 hypothetical protein [Cryobacterium sp.]
MEILIGGIVLGLIAFVIYGFVMFAGMLLGFPMERKKTADKRQEVAAQLWKDKLNAEAARNVQLRAAEKRLGK